MTQVIADHVAYVAASSSDCSCDGSPSFLMTGNQVESITGCADVTVRLQAGLLVPPAIASKIECWETPGRSRRVHWQLHWVRPLTFVMYHRLRSRRSFVTGFALGSLPETGGRVPSVAGFVRVCFSLRLLRFVATGTHLGRHACVFDRPTDRPTDKKMLGELGNPN